MEYNPVEQNGASKPVRSHLQEQGRVERTHITNFENQNGKVNRAPAERSKLSAEWPGKVKWKMINGGLTNKRFCVRITSRYRLTTGGTGPKTLTPLPRNVPYHLIDH